jgi:molybdenum cofactor cytidylyltransferase
MPRQVDCLLLAAGGSQRMGQPKLLLEVGGHGTILEIVLLSHLASSVRRICAVTAGWLDGFDDIVSRYGSERLEFIKIAGPCPMSESLKTGWRWLKTETKPDGVMISLADKPLVTADTVNLMVRTFRESGKGICVPVHDGEWGHPVVIASSFGDEIMQLTSDQGAREVLLRHRDEIEEVKIDSDEVLVDVDRLSDMDIIRSRFGAHE